MAYTFDGPNQLIILSTGTTAVTVEDMYSRWKDWTIISDNSKYLLAFSSLGGDPLPGGLFLGATYFLENGWKIRPYEGNQVLTVTGNLYARDGSDPFVSTLGSYNVRVMLTVSNLIDTVSTGGGVGTADEVRDAVWSDTNFASHGDGTAGVKLSDAGSAGDPWATDLSSGYTGTQAGALVPAIKGLIQLLVKYESNRTRVDKTAFTLTVYDDDGTTPIEVFDLKNFLGAPSYTEVAERVPQ